MKTKLPKIKYHLKSQQGFTLIELLVVVMVIAALSGVLVSMINTGGFRDKAKDSQRIADLKQTQTALELYFADFRAYPVSASWIEVSGSDALSTVLSPTYINKIPVDPDTTGSAGVGSPCAAEDSATRYNYRSSATGNIYTLTSTMALADSTEGHLCNALNNWGSLGCSGGSLLRCYGVENP